MGQQYFVVRYFNSQVYRKPSRDTRTGQLMGGSLGWQEFLCYGRALAKLKAAQLAAIHGESNVHYEPFVDLVKNPYKRRGDKKEFRRKHEREDLDTPDF